MINLSTFVRAHALADPQRTALSFDGAEMSYGVFDRSILAVAGGVRDKGVGAGDVVALLMKNSVAMLQAAFAVSHLGAVMLPLNFRLSASEVAYILEDANVRLLIVDEELVHLAPAGLANIVVPLAALGDAAGLFQSSADAEPYPRAPTDLFRLMYTSGTTDRPKGVMHSYENFYWKSSDHVIALGLNAETRLLCAGPLYHVGAFDLPGVAVLWAGGMLSVHREFEPDAVLRAIASERLNAAWLAPVMTSGLLACPTAKDHDLSSLRWVVAGGERTPEARVREFGTVFPNARYIDAYGLTESCSGDTLMPAGYELTKIGSTGRALMHVALTIRDEAGAELPRGEEGEICLRGPKVTKGYWNDPEKTRRAFIDGWFRTGDVGYLDEDGFLFITDRKKDMIISGGENIASSEIERALQLLAGVADVAVIGLPDPQWGERPIALIVPQPGEALDETMLRTHCRAHLAGFKVPRTFLFRTTLPRNPSGKILKRQLRDELLAEQA